MTLPEWLSRLPDQTFDSRKLKLAIISKCLFFREIFVTDKRALSGPIGRQSQQKQIAKKIAVECSSKGLFGLWIWNLQRIKLSDSDLLQIFSRTTFEPEARDCNFDRQFSRAIGQSLPKNHTNFYKCNFLLATISLLNKLVHRVYYWIFNIFSIVQRN